MRLPDFASNYDAAKLTICTAKYLEALKLFHEESYEHSIEVLKHAINSSQDTSVNNHTPLVSALALLGWNLVFLKSFVALSEWEVTIQELGFEFNSSPDLELVLLWKKCYRGEAVDVCQRASVFIDANRQSLSALLPDFLFVRSYAAFGLGRFELAAEDSEMAYSFYKMLQKSPNEAKTANFLGMAYRAMSSYGDSEKWFDRSLKIYQHLGMLRKQSMVHLNMGVTHYKTGDYTASFKSLNISHKIGKEGNWSHRMCFSNIALANVHRITRDFTSARKHLHTAYNQAQKLGFPREESLALEFLGDVYRDEGKFSEARRFYGRAGAIAKEIAPEGDIIMEVHRRLGECFLNEGDTLTARAELDAALGLARRLGDRYEEAVILRVMSEACRVCGDSDAAHERIAESIEILEAIGARHEHAISLYSATEHILSDLNQGLVKTTRSGMLSDAWTLATKALDLFLKVDVPWWTAKARAMVDDVSCRRVERERADRESQSGACSLGYDPGRVIIHHSRRMQDLLTICDMFANTIEPVLVTGETGTGKELIAKRLHERSDRREKPLVAVNVAAIPPTMFEREFFGHVKGAFSSAESDSPGYAGRADGGTLFLDEIGELPLETQPKLLRLLQEGTYQAIGDPQERRTNIRLVAATNADLERRVAEGSFRADLFFRLKILELEIPPVRERPEDILLLMRHFLSLAANRPVELSEYFNRPSITYLEEYDWPGNVREVAMVARRAHVFLSTKGYVELGLAVGDGQSLMLTGPGLLAAAATEGSGSAPPTTRENVERTRIMMALDQCDGNRLEASRLLGIGRSTLYRRMEKLGIPAKR